MPPPGFVQRLHLYVLAHRQAGKAEVPGMQACLDENGSAMSRFHVVDPHCGVAGGEDFGAVDTREQAEKIVADRVAGGDEGGCRCGRGYRIQTCEERIKNSLGWRERQEQDTRLFDAGLMSLRGYRPEDGVKRELTSEEIATHKCYDYQPRRFSEILHDRYEEIYSRFPEVGEVNSDEN